MRTHESTFTPAVLFNCCTDHGEPDWSQFDALEIGGCADDGDGNTNGGLSRSEAEFFTVYGHFRSGGVEALTDVPTYEGALGVADELARRSSLPITLHPTL